MPEENKDLNPQISEVVIGVRNLRKLTIYPLSLSDQLKFTDLIGKALTNAPLDGEANIEFVAFIINFLQENLASILGLITDGEDPQELLADITNAQATQIAEVVFDVNFGSIAKNIKGLSSKLGKVFRLERPLPTFVNDTPDTDLNISSSEDSAKEE